MTDLTSDLVLCRVPDVRVDIDSSNNVRVLYEDKTYHLGPHGLAVLDAFYRPVSMCEALEKLRATCIGAQDWIALVATIMQLYDAGILRDETQRRSKLETGRGGFGAPLVHVRMLNDRTRTSSFLAGIAEVVSPGDVVVDIGTGTGVLAVAAARAGAKHVYAIEASAIGEVAEAIFEANGLTERITLLRGWSTRISLPERADVLISEMIGNEPLHENVLETTRDARERLLKPGARLVPSTVHIFGLPVTIPPTELMKRTVTSQTLRNWQSWYDIDFGPLTEVVRGSAAKFYIEPREAGGWKALSEPILLADIDLKEARDLSIENTVTVAAETSGLLDGLLVYFELELGPTTRLSTHPAQVGKDNHWTNKVWVLDPLPLQKGDQFDVTYQYRAAETTYSITVSRS